MFYKKGYKVDRSPIGTLSFHNYKNFKKLSVMANLSGVRRIYRELAEIPEKQTGMGTLVRQKVFADIKPLTLSSYSETITSLELQEAVASKYIKNLDKVSNISKLSSMYASVLRNVTFAALVSLRFFIQHVKNFKTFRAQLYCFYFFKLYENILSRKISKRFVNNFLFAFHSNVYLAEYNLFKDSSRLKLISKKRKKLVVLRTVAFRFGRGSKLGEVIWPSVRGGKRRLFIFDFRLKINLIFSKTMRKLQIGEGMVTNLTNIDLGGSLWKRTAFDTLFLNSGKLLSTLSSFYGLVSRRFRGLPATVLGFYNHRSMNYGFGYRRLFNRLNQSWGNSGNVLSPKINRHGSKFKLKYRSYVLRGKYLEAKVANLYNTTISGLVIAANESYLRSGKRDGLVVKKKSAYFEWAKAGYVVLSNFRNFKSRVNLVRNTAQNLNVCSESRAFGHPFHLVNPSVLPLTLSFVFFTLIQDVLSSFCLEMWYVGSLAAVAHVLMIGLFFSVILTWIFEIYSEEQSGAHTLEVQGGFKYAVLLFILSELMLFVSFFWAYFHFSLNSNSFTGGTYAARGVIPFYASRIPFLNTLLLLSSGLSLTVAHTLVVESDKLIKTVTWFELLYKKSTSDWLDFWNKFEGGYSASLQNTNVSEYFLVFTGVFLKRFRQLAAKLELSKKRGLSVSKQALNDDLNYSDKIGRVSNDFQVSLPISFLINYRSDEKNTIWQPNYWILDTVLKGFVFLIFQAYEYTSCMFSMNDGVYGAVFFSLTGLHGVHVYLGVMFLFFGLLVNLKKNIGRSYFRVGSLYSVFISRSSTRGSFLKSSMNSKIWTHRVAFDGAAWYWHFVDVVWFFVFVFVYAWGFATTSY